MDKTIVNILIVLCLGLVSESKAQKTNNKMSNRTFTQEQKNVMTTIEKMVSAFEAGDIEGVMSTYESNAAIVFEPGEPVSGAPSIEEAFKQAFGINPQYTFGGHEVFVIGEIAVHLTPWEMTGELPGGTEVQQSGLSVAVLRKQSDGKWLMIFDNPHGQFLLENQ